MESRVEDGSLSAPQNAQAGHMDLSEYSGEHKPALFGRLSSPGTWRARGLRGTAEGLGPHAAEAVSSTKWQSRSSGQCVTSVG